MKTKKILSAVMALAMSATMITVPVQVSAAAVGFNDEFNSGTLESAGWVHYKATDDTTLQTSVSNGGLTVTGDGLTGELPGIYKTLNGETGITCAEDELLEVRFEYKQNTADRNADSLDLKINTKDLTASNYSQTIASLQAHRLEVYTGGWSDITYGDGDKVDAVAYLNLSTGTGDWSATATNINVATQNNKSIGNNINVSTIYDIGFFARNRGDGGINYTIDYVSVRKVKKASITAGSTTENNGVQNINLNTDVAIDEASLSGLKLMNGTTEIALSIVSYSENIITIIPSSALLAGTYTVTGLSGLTSNGADLLDVNDELSVSVIRAGAYLVNDDFNSGTADTGWENYASSTDATLTTAISDGALQITGNAETGEVPGIYKTLNGETGITCAEDELLEVKFGYTENGKNGSTSSLDLKFNTKDLTTSNYSQQIATLQAARIEVYNGSTWGDFYYNGTNNTGANSQKIDVVAYFNLNTGYGEWSVKSNGTTVTASSGSNYKMGPISNTTTIYDIGFFARLRGTSAPINFSMDYVTVRKVKEASITAGTTTEENGVQNININTDVAIDNSSLSGLKLMNGTTEIALSSVSYSENIITIIPSSALLAGTYTVTGLSGLTSNGVDLLNVNDELSVSVVRAGAYLVNDEFNSGTFADTGWQHYASSTDATLNATVSNGALQLTGTAETGEVPGIYKTLNGETGITCGEDELLEVKFGYTENSKNSQAASIDLKFNKKDLTTSNYSQMVATLQTQRVELYSGSWYDFNFTAAGEKTDVLAYFDLNNKTGDWTVGTTSTATATKSGYAMGTIANTSPIYDIGFFARNRTTSAIDYTIDYVSVRKVKKANIALAEVIGTDEAEKITLSTTVAIDDCSGIKLMNGATEISAEVSYADNLITIVPETPLLNGTYTVTGLSGLVSGGVDVLDIDDISVVVNILPSVGDLELYVSPSGNDSAEGTSAAPLATLGAAVNKAKTVSASTTTIILADGEYETTSTVDITGISGTVTIKAAEGATPVIKGSKTVAIADMTSEAVTGRVTAEGIKSYSLEDYTLATDICNEVQSVQATNTFGVYVDGEIKPIAEYPNNDELAVDDEFATTSPGADNAITLQANDKFGAYANYTDWYMEGYFAEIYRTYKVHNSKFTVNSDNTITFNELKSTDVKINRNWKIFNVLEELDVAGEWYVDTTAKKLYYMPGTETEIEISNMMDALIKVNQNNVTIKGITFKNTCKNAIGIADGKSDVTITGCDFTAIGRNAILGNNGITDTAILGNTIENVGFKGIYLRDGGLDTLTPSGNVVAENVISDTGKIVRSNAHGIQVSGVGAEVKNNEISNTKSTALGFEGALHKIHHNKLVNVVTEAKDAGAIYSGRNLKWLGNEIYNNDITLPVRAAGDEIIGIYLDDFLSGTEVHHNIVRNASRGIYSNSGAENNIYNNVLIGCTNNGVTIRKRAVPETWTTALTKPTEAVYATTFSYLSTFDADVWSGANIEVYNNYGVNITTMVETKDYTTDGYPAFDIYKNENNVAVNTEIEGVVKADIDTNDIGIPVAGLDNTIYYAKINANTVTVDVISAYANYKVVAAAYNASGKMVGVAVLDETHKEFTASETPTTVKVIVVENFNTMKPMTK